MTLGESWLDKAHACMCIADAQVQVHLHVHLHAHMHMHMHVHTRLPRQLAQVPTAALALAEAYTLKTSLCTLKINIASWKPVHLS